MGFSKERNPRIRGNTRIKILCIGAFIFFSYFYFLGGEELENSLNEDREMERRQPEDMELEMKNGVLPAEDKDLDKEEAALPVEDMEVEKEEVVLPSTLDFLVVACGGSREDENIERQFTQTNVMLKSAALLTKTVLNFHIVAENHVFSRMVNDTKSWPNEFQKKLMFSHHPIWYPKEEEFSYLKTMFRECATERLFTPDHILPTVEKVVYVDTDTIFFQPPEDLYSYFHSFDNQQFAGMTPCLFHYGTDSNKVPFYGDSGVNAGIFLMHLERMRKWSEDWFSTVMQITEQYKNMLVLGDQDVMNALFNQFPERLHVLPCQWNFRSEVCQEGKSKCLAAGGVSLLHGNALSFVNGGEMTVQSIFEAFKSFDMASEKPPQLLHNIHEAIKKVIVENQPSECKMVPEIESILLGQLDIHLK